MEFIKNYALFLESKAYSKVNESAVEEAATAPDMQSDAGLKKIMSGENGGAYTTQWNQLVDHMTANKKKDGTYTVLINHDNGKPMTNLEYKVVGQKIDWNSVKLSAATATATAASPDFAKLQTLANDLSAKIVKLFEEDSPFFAEFKGNWNDDDSAAAKAFDKWYNTFGTAKINELRAGANAMTDATLKAIAIANADAIDKAKDKIIKKMEGYWDTDDTVTWKIGDADGMYKTYKVDTDF